MEQRLTPNAPVDAFYSGRPLVLQLMRMRMRMRMRIRMRIRMRLRLRMRMRCPMEQRLTHNTPVDAFYYP